MRGRPAEERASLLENLKRTYTERTTKRAEDRLGDGVAWKNAQQYEPPCERNMRGSAEGEADEHFANVIDCGICGNKAEIATIKDGAYAQRPCECRAKRINLIRLENSGLIDLVNECTFERYETPTEFQAKIKRKALEFVDKATGGYAKKWFFFGGQVGAGKTHICTAIVGALINKNYSAKYMMYRDEATHLKSIVAREPEEYSRKVEFLKSVDVLYIDDLFKTKNGGEHGREKPAPTAGDVNLMFEIINARYNNKTRITVISSEKSIDEIMEIDEGIGSRINRRSSGYVINVNTDKSKNWRLRGP
jgi:DNA replication protein DnaC